MKALVGTIYGFGNITFMMWYGYGGAKTLPIPESTILILTIYLLIIILAVYLPLWALNEGERKAAIFGVLVPWIFLVVIALPQKEAPEMIMLAGSIIAVLLLTRKPIERVIQKSK